MSASNWATCPKCFSDNEEAVRQQAAKVAETYGKVSVEEFDAARRVLALRVDKKLDQTLREDYEIWGAGDGVVRVSYGCGCEVCGLSLSFGHEHQLWPAEVTP
jgi:hypothetical protein